MSSSAEHLTAQSIGAEMKLGQGRQLAQVIGNPTWCQNTNQIIIEINDAYKRKEKTHKRTEDDRGRERQRETEKEREREREREVEGG